MQLEMSALHNGHIPSSGSRYEHHQIACLTMWGFGNEMKFL